MSWGSSLVLESTYVVSHGPNISETKMVGRELKFTKGRWNRRTPMLIIWTLINKGVSERSKGI
jgi:hypothetical protein